MNEPRESTVSTANKANPSPTGLTTNADHASARTKNSKRQTQIEATGGGANEKALRRPRRPQAAREL